MEWINPIYTEKTECQDCYKCVRGCLFKAIKIENGHALVIHENCVYCGKCVEICPPKAKRVRNDLSRIELLLHLGKKVIASVAPAALAELDYPIGKLVAGLKKLGFYGVSETALGAEELSAAIRKTKPLQKVSISSSCPTVVEIINKYYPQYSSYISHHISPVLTHCKMLKEQFGEDTEVVFIGPCISKKLEADRNPDLLNLSMTFEELKEWFRKTGIQPQELEEEEWITQRSREGNFYPIDGGFLKTIKSDCSITDHVYFSFSGIANLMKVFDDLDRLPDDGKSYVIEALACDGGCINGPMASKEKSSLLKRIAILRCAPQEYEDRVGQIQTEKVYLPSPVALPEFSETRITEMLRSLGKMNHEDELNCGGCGYDSCRDLATAVLAGKAEKAMCVAHNRRLAQKKANVLIQTIPSGVVIVNEKLEIIECNLNFARLFFEEAGAIYEVKPGLEGALLDKIIPHGIAEYFKVILSSGKDILERDVKVGNQFLHFTIFSIEKYHIVGGVFQDVTSPMVQKRNIIEKAQNVITKNLKTVQTIANLLGENAADTEIILNSIIESFTVNNIDEE